MQDTTRHLLATALNVAQPSPEDPDAVDQPGQVIADLHQSTVSSGRLHMEIKPCHHATVRHLLTLTGPQNMREVADPESLDADRPKQDRRELADLLAQAVPGGLQDRRAIERALLLGEPAACLPASLPAGGPAPA